MSENFETTHDRVMSMALRTRFEAAQNEEAAKRQPTGWYVELSIPGGQNGDREVWYNAGPFASEAESIAGAANWMRAMYQGLHAAAIGIHGSENLTFESIAKLQRGIDGETLVPEPMPGVALLGTLTRQQRRLLRQLGTDVENAYHALASEADRARRGAAREATPTTDDTLDLLRRLRRNPPPLGPIVRRASDGMAGDLPGAWDEATMQRLDAKAMRHGARSKPPPRACARTRGASSTRHRRSGTSRFTRTRSTTACRPKCEASSARRSGSWARWSTPRLPT